MALHGVMRDSEMAKQTRVRKKNVVAKRNAAKEGVAARLNLKPASGLWISEGKFRGLKISSIGKVLCTSEEDFRGHKEIIFAAFKAWLLSSLNHKESRHAIAIAVADRIVKVEKSRAGQHVNFRQALKRFDPKYSPLFDRVYDHIGCMAAIRSAIRAEEKKNIKKEKDKQAAKKKKKDMSVKNIEIPVRHLTATALLWDYHQRALGNNRQIYGHLALTRHGKLAHLIARSSAQGTNGSKTKSVTTNAILFRYWNPHWRAVPFFYGAENTKLQDGRSLLELLLNGALTLKTAEPFFADWFGFTQYFLKEIGPRIQLKTKKVNGEKKKRKFPTLNGVESKAPPLPELDKASVAMLDRKLKEKKPSERRTA